MITVPIMYAHGSFTKAQRKRIMEVYGDDKCPAPPASDDEKRSPDIGAPLLLGHYETGVLTQLLENSRNQVVTFQSLHDQVFMQNNQISDLQETVKFLAEQVKTLVDALAEDQDPDMPVTSYLSGKPL